MAVVYPKVKVRQDEEDDKLYALEISSLQSLRAFDSLSLNDFSSSDDSPKSVVRIPMSYMPDSAIPRGAASKGGTNNIKRTISDQSRTVIKAGSVPPPRAVLSSPDNDGMIGSKVKRREKLQSEPKSHNSCQHRHTQCKFVPRPIVFGRPLDTIKEPKEDRVKNDRRAKSREVVDPRKRVYTGKGKPETF